MTNFGLEPFLRTLVELAPHAAAAAERHRHRRARPTSASPASSSRSRRTWIRATAIASRSSASAPGKFTKDMAVSNSRGGKLLRASRAYRFFGRDRETITEAYAGDIIGLVNPGQFAIGDTRAHRRAAAVPRHAALSGRSTSARAAPAGHALQAVRRRAAAARGRGADAGVLRRRAAAASRSSASSARCSST